MFSSSMDNLNIDSGANKSPTQPPTTPPAIRPRSSSLPRNFSRKSLIRSHSHSHGLRRVSTPAPRCSSPLVRKTGRSMEALAAGLRRSVRDSASLSPTAATQVPSSPTSFFGGGAGSSNPMKRPHLTQCDSSRRLPLASEPSSPAHPSTAFAPQHQQQFTFPPFHHQQHTMHAQPSRMPHSRSVPVASPSSSSHSCCSGARDAMACAADGERLQRRAHTSASSSPPGTPPHRRPLSAAAPFSRRLVEGRVRTAATRRSLPPQRPASATGATAYSSASSTGGTSGDSSDDGSMLST